MKRDYKVTIRHYTKGSISACDVANIIKEDGGYSNMAEVFNNKNN